MHKYGTILLIMNKEPVSSAVKPRQEKTPLTYKDKVHIAIVAMNLISMAGMAANGAGVFNDIKAKPTTVENATPASQAPYQPQMGELLSGTQVIKIERLHGENEPIRYPDGHITTEVREAGRILSGISDGAFKFPEIDSLHTVKLVPNGIYTNVKDKQSVECYTDEQIDRAQSAYLSAEGLPAETSMITVINQGDSCSMLPMAAVGIVDNVNNMRIGTMYADSFTRNVILHEEGHLLGLPHAAVAACEGSFKGASPTEKPGVDISKIIEKGCAVPLTSHPVSGDIIPNMYSDETTVMGGIPYEVRNAEDHFSSVELTKLVPDIAQNINAGIENATYPISSRHGKTRTISVAIPEGHPLRQIDPNIDTLSVGMAYLINGNESTETVQLIAHHDQQSYQLKDAAYPYMPAADKDKGPIELYHDETLGMKILLSPNEDGRSVDVTIEKLE